MSFDQITFGAPGQAEAAIRESQMGEKEIHANYSTLVGIYAPGKCLAPSAAEAYDVPLDIEMANSG